MHEPQHDLLSAYIDQACTPQEAEQLTAHLGGCLICRDALDALLALRLSLRSLPSPALGFDLAAQLQDRLHPKPQPKQRNLSRWFTWQPAGLAIAASLVAGLWLGTLIDTGSQPSTLATNITMVRVFDPVPPGSLCTASTLCPQTKDLMP